MAQLIILFLYIVANLGTMCKYLRVPLAGTSLGDDFSGRVEIGNRAGVSLAVVVDGHPNRSVISTDLR